MIIDQNITVYVRARPLGPQEKEAEVDIDEENNEIRLCGRQFHFDKPFPSETTQSQIYDVVVEPLVKQMLLGYNCTVLAYGPTGTGKTYTIEGNRDCSELSLDSPEIGIIPRVVKQLFQTLKSQYSIKISFLELYNEDVYDLLGSELTKLKLYEGNKGVVIVDGLQYLDVQSENDIYEILSRGSSRRRTAATQCNEWSSRSHSIFSLKFSHKEITNGEEVVRTGKLNLVDLAGSENISRTGRIRETGSINQSLLTLGRVITALAEKRSHIPYRESKLTRLLQDSLGGSARTSIIATISPAISNLEDTLSTLEYASRARKITNKLEMNQIRQKMDLEIEIQKLCDKHSQELCDQETRLREELAKELEMSVRRIKQSYDEQLEKNKQSYCEQNQKSKQSSEEQLEKVRQYYKEEQEKFKQAYEEKDKKFKLSCEEEIEKLKNFHEEEKKILQMSCEEENIKLKKFYEEQNIKLKEFYEEENIKLKKSHEEDREMLKMTYEAEKEMLKKSYEEKNDKLKRFYEEENEKQQRSCDETEKLMRSYKEENDKLTQCIKEQKLNIQKLSHLQQVNKKEEDAKELEILLQEAKKTHREEIEKLTLCLKEQQLRIEDLTQMHQVHKKVRTEAPLDQNSDYANYTFECDDIVHVSTKKHTKQNRKLILSGKKQKIDPLAAELSPIVTTKRVTRSSKRKLMY